MVDTGHIPGLGYMEIVDQRDAATLLPIIRDHILPGTTVWSDKMGCIQCSSREQGRIQNFLKGGSESGVGLEGRS